MELWNSATATHVEHESLSVRKRSGTETTKAEGFAKKAKFSFRFCSSILLLKTLRPLYTGFLDIWNTSRKQLQAIVSKALNGNLSHVKVKSEWIFAKGYFHAEYFLLWRLTLKSRNQTLWNGRSFFSQRNLQQKRKKVKPASASLCSRSCSVSGSVCSFESDIYSLRRGIKLLKGFLCRKCLGCRVNELLKFQNSTHREHCCRQRPGEWIHHCVICLALVVEFSFWHHAAWQSF